MHHNTLVAINRRINLNDSCCPSADSVIDLSIRGKVAIAEVVANGDYDDCLGHAAEVLEAEGLRVGEARWARESCRETILVEVYGVRRR